MITSESRVSYPDPDSSGQWIRIRIPIRNPDADPGEQKGTTKVEFILEISCFEVVGVLF
jgi:hypothetical protein